VTQIASNERLVAARGLSPEALVMGVLLQGGGERRGAGRQCVAMSRCPLVDELVVARRPRQQDPSGAAAERLAHRHELRSPAFERSEIARQRVAQRRTRLALVAETVEEQLVQD